jgi:hypothetical protein
VRSAFDDEFGPLGWGEVELKSGEGRRSFASGGNASIHVTIDGNPVIRIGLLLNIDPREIRDDGTFPGSAWLTKVEELTVPGLASWVIDQIKTREPSSWIADKEFGDVSAHLEFYGDGFNLSAQKK